MALSKSQQKSLWGAILVILLVLIFDQSSKFWVKTNMQLYDSIEIFSWFKIYFVENPGMAFGIEIIDTNILTVFRLIVVGWFGFMTCKFIKRDFKFGYIVCLSLIIAGAFGNIIDCLFYGVLFDHSYGQIATFMPAEGYSTFFHGKVVDMLSFPLIETTWPSWVPGWGGQSFVFFRPIFNIADSAICVSGFILLLFYRQSLSASLSKERKTDDE